MLTVAEPSPVSRLSNDRVSLSIDAGFGARVTELCDLATGRQWLLPGPRTEDVGEAAVYRGAASRGWDECFPTILPCDHQVWGGRLRDHGMLWGRAWTVTDAGSDAVAAVFEAEGIRFTRRLALSGGQIVATYSVTSARETDVPYMWSQHCVLQVTPADRIDLSGTGRMQTDGLAFDWPDHPGRNLRWIGPEDEGFVLKAYALSPTTASAKVTGRQGGLQFDWDGHAVPALGLWLDYGGWPEEAPLHQVAIEPTTAAADDLSGAIALGQERWLAPGDTHNWSVRLTLLDPEEGPVP